MTSTLEGTEYIPAKGCKELTPFLQLGRVQPPSIEKFGFLDPAQDCNKEDVFPKY